MTMKKPASFLVPTVTFTFNMMEAARRCGVKRFTQVLLEYMLNLKYLMKIVLGKHFHQKMINLLAGLRDCVNYKPMHIKYMAGMQFIVRPGMFMVH